MLNVHDLEVIKKVEGKLGVKLPKRKRISREIGYSTNTAGRIESLNLSGLGLTNFRQIASDVKNLQELVILDLDGNKLTGVSALKGLSSLKALSLSGNSVTDISSLPELSQLTSLSLSGNKIDDFSPLSSLSQLDTLHINGVHLKDLFAIQELKGLKILSLGGNELKDIEPLKGLTELIELRLEQNQIKNIAPLKHLLKLEFLFVSFNQISDISPLQDLKQLKDLSLHDNKIEDISPLKNLTQLSYLYLKKNNIRDISHLGSLMNLQGLFLYQNQIEDISPLQHLKDLRTLSLSDNPIKNLPKWITDFKMKIKWSDSWEDGAITLQNDLIETPPIEIVKEGKEAIRRYFSKVQEEGTDFIHEAKLILVGEGSAGKTSLQMRILNPNRPLPKKENRTRGVKINDWVFKRVKSRSHIAHIWDFGGQDVYYPVHRFFLTENSVFVLLASTRQTHHNFDYWIPTIYQFGGKSPIILGQTCHEGNKVPWNDLGYYIANPNFNIIKTQEIPYQEINLTNQNEGLNKIKQIIVNQIESLPHYGKGVPTSWIPVRELLAAKAETIACLSFAAFEELCKQSNPKAFSELVDIVDCAKFLHSIGVLLWYYNIPELRDWLVLQPEWAMNAVYEIIDDEEIQKRRGIIQSQDFNRLWIDKVYESKHFILKKMLEVFKIAFPKKHRREDYIIPARLLSMPTNSKWSNSETYLRLNYKYEFMPKGLVNQLSAELSRYIIADEQVWNNAVNFGNGGTAEAQVEEDFYNREMNIKAKGRDARGLIMIIMDALKNITDGYKGVTPQIFVPCTCSSCRTNSDPTTYLYAKLIRWSSNKENARVTCNESGDSLLIEELLYNVGLPYPNKQKNEPMLSKTIKLFLASSSELKDDREQFEIFINRENKRLNKEGIFLELNLWEDFIDAMSKNRLQDEYNRSVKESDIFVSLFRSKVGKFTAEEFEYAFREFKTTGKPYIYTFFKDENTNITQIKRDDINSKFDFEEKLKNLGHFPTIYKNIEDLKYQFKSQLDKVLPSLR